MPILKTSGKTGTVIFEAAEIFRAFTEIELTEIGLSEISCEIIRGFSEILAGTETFETARGLA